MTRDWYFAQTKPIFRIELFMIPFLYLCVFNWNRSLCSMKYVASDVFYEPCFRLQYWRLLLLLLLWLPMQNVRFKYSISFFQLHFFLQYFSLFLSLLLPSWILYFFPFIQTKNLIRDSKDGEHILHAKTKCSMKNKNLNICSFAVVCQVTFFYWF